jgi:hypothetical protein
MKTVTIGDNRISITIGAKYGGHGKYDKYVMEANHSLKEMIDAYKATCKLIGLQISDGADYTGTNDYKNHLCSEYQKCTATKDQYDQFLKYGINLQQYSGNTIEEDDHNQYVWLNEPELFRNLIIDMMKVSLPTLICEEAYFKNSELRSYKPDGSCLITGLTESRELSGGFGYGIYD